MNYFYDILPLDIREYIIKIKQEEEIENRKYVIRNVYKPWYVRKHDWGHSIEEYRHQVTMNKFWYMDMFIKKDECGGLIYLRSNLRTTRDVFNVFHSCDLVDQLVLLNVCQNNRLIPKKINKNVVDIGCDVYIGNWWKVGYTSPLDDVLDLANDAYDDRMLI